ncbi:hypothetical protein QEN19_003064 [Hanseniaspora menglaensis]
MLDLYYITIKVHWVPLVGTNGSLYSETNLMKCVEFNYNIKADQADQWVNVVAYARSGELCLSIPDVNYNLTLAKKIMFVCMKKYYDKKTLSMIGPISEYDVDLRKIGTIIEVGINTLRLDLDDVSESYAMRLSLTKNDYSSNDEIFAQRDYCDGIVTDFIKAPSPRLIASRILLIPGLVLIRYTNVVEQSTVKCSDLLVSMQLNIPILVGEKGPAPAEMPAPHSDAELSQRQFITELSLLETIPNIYYPIEYTA